MSFRLRWGGCASSAVAPRPGAGTAGVAVAPLRPGGVSPRCAKASAAGRAGATLAVQMGSWGRRDGGRGVAPASVDDGQG